MNEVRRYAIEVGKKPATVIQQATTHGGTTWAKWEAGASCTVPTMQLVKAYMRKNRAKKRKAA